MMHLTAIVLAAGRGLRFSRSGKSQVSKLLAEVKSKPIIIHSLRRFSECPLTREIIVVVNNRNSRAIISKIRQYRIGKISRIVGGGRRRQDSVYCGLRLMDKRTDLVLIHDAARPFIDKKTIISVVREAERSGAAIVGVPVKATIKTVVRPLRGGSASLRSRSSLVARRNIVKRTLNREDLYEIQTPQVFRKDLILQAYKKFNHKIDATDDAMLVEKLGAKVSVVLGSYRNIKITTPDDLAVAESISKAKGLRRKK